MGANGEHIFIEDESVAGVGPADVESFRELRRKLSRCAAALEPFWLKTIPRIGPGSLPDMLTFAHLGLNLRRMGKNDMHEFLRIASLPVRDLMDECFENEILKAAATRGRATSTRVDSFIDEGRGFGYRG